MKYVGRQETTLEYLLSKHNLLDDEIAGLQEEVATLEARVNALTEIVSYAEELAKLPENASFRRGFRGYKGELSREKEALEQRQKSLSALLVSQKAVDALIAKASETSF